MSGTCRGHRTHSGLQAAHEKIFTNCHHSEDTVTFSSSWPPCALTSGIWILFKVRSFPSQSFIFGERIASEMYDFTSLTAEKKTFLNIFLYYCKYAMTPVSLLIGNICVCLLSKKENKFILFLFSYMSWSCDRMVQSYVFTLT